MKMMLPRIVVLIATNLMFNHFGVEGFFLPQRLMDFFGLLYESMNPMKIGSNSRLGIVYEHGRSADVEILLEFGPQAESQPSRTIHKKDLSWKKGLIINPKKLKKGDYITKKERMSKSLPKKVTWNKFKPANTTKLLKDKVESEGEKWLLNWRGLASENRSSSLEPDKGSDRTASRHNIRMKVSEDGSKKNSKKNDGDLAILQSLFGDPSHDLKDSNRKKVIKKLF